MQVEVALEGVAIGGKERPIGDDLCALSSRVRTEEAGEHQVEVDGQRVHGDDLGGLGSDSTS